MEGQEGDDNDIPINVTGAVVVLDLNVLPPTDSNNFLEIFIIARDTARLLETTLRQKNQTRELEARAEEAKVRLFKAREALLDGKLKLEEFIQSLKLEAQEENAKLEKKLEQIGDRQEEREKAIQEFRKTAANIVLRIMEFKDEIEEITKIVEDFSDDSDADVAKDID